MLAPHAARCMPLVRTAAGVTLTPGALARAGNMRENTPPLHVAQTPWVRCVANLIWWLASCRCRAQGRRRHPLLLPLRVLLLLLLLLLMLLRQLLLLLRPLLPLLGERRRSFPLTFR